MLAYDPSFTSFLYHTLWHVEAARLSADTVRSHRVRDTHTPTHRIQTRSPRSPTMCGAGRPAVRQSITSEVRARTSTLAPLQPACVCLLIVLRFTA